MIAVKKSDRDVLKIRKKVMKESEKHAEKNALLGMFPSVNSFEAFEEDHIKSKLTSDSIIGHAFKTGLIRESSRDAFLDFLSENENPDASSLSENITFGEIIDFIAKPSVNALLPHFSKISEKFQMDEINGPMLSRMKKGKFNPDSLKQCDTLRILVYWIGKKYPD